MKLKVITSNPGKAAEFARSFADMGVEMEHLRMPYEEVQADGLERVVEAGMAEIRSKGMRDFLIDDSGMFIDALGGFPGVYSAYVQSTLGNRGVLKQMEGVEDRGAEFRCCIGCDVGGETVVVTGRCRGSILRSERGSNGFGYDPIFSPDGVRSFAEVPAEEKNAVSHRGDAVRLLKAELARRGLLR